MHLNFTASDLQQLEAIAAQKGFENVEDYARTVLQQVVEAESFLPMTDQELEANAKMCDRGMAEAEAGLGRDYNVVLGEIAERLGLTDLK